MTSRALLPAATLTVELEAAEARAAKLAEALAGAQVALRAARGVVVNKHEHALITGALVCIAEALSGLDALAALQETKT